MESILRGTKIKLDLNIKPFGELHLKDVDFEVTLFTQSIKNGYCIMSKDVLIYLDDDNYAIPFDTSLLPCGRLKVVVKVNVPDEDFELGLREELILLHTDVTIVEL